MNAIAGLGPGEFWALATALLWAIAVILFRYSGGQLPPMALNLFKNGIGLSLMLITIAVIGRPFPDMPPLALALTLLSGVLGIGLGDTLYFRALDAVGAARMAVAQALFSPFVIVLAILFLGERLGPWQWLGVAAVLTGVTLVSLQRGGDAGENRRVAIGMATGVASVLTMAIGIVLAKPLLAAWDFLWIVTLRIVGGVLSLVVVIGLRGDAPLLWQAARGVRRWWIIVVAAVFSTYLSMLTWLAGYKYAQASVAAVLNELASVFIVLMAAGLLRERLTRRIVAGIALAFGGVAAVVFG